MKLKGTTVIAGLAGLVTGLLSYLPGAIAAETVLLTYGPLSMSVPITELETLAETGEPSGQLEQLLKLANQDPASIQSTLNDPVSVNLVVLDMALNSPPGEWALDRVGEVIHPASGAASRQALRAALIGSASDDNEITLLEVLQAYPTQELVVRGDRLVETYNRLYEILEPLEGLAEILGRDIFR